MTNAFSEGDVNLTVRAADSATEIFLMDARLRRLRKTVGTLETTVPPGLYKLRLRAGQTQLDRLLEVPPGGIPPLALPPLRFVTPVPLEDTEGADAAHQAMVRESLEEAGASLCLFCRVPDGAAAGGFAGLDVHARDGRRLAGFGDAPRGGPEGLATLALALDPGPVRLRAAARGDAPAHELFVPVVRGWRTLVFAFCDAPQEQGGPHLARLQDASVVLLPLDAAFEPGDASLRLSELLRLGLENARPLLPGPALDAVEAAGGRLPMLDILAGHLLLRGRLPDDTAPERCAARAHAQLGDLPDSAALRLGRGGGTPPQGLLVEAPPMLRPAWALIVAATKRRMGLVPYGSLAAQAGEGLVSHPLWLLSGQVGARPQEGEAAMSFAAASRFLERLIAMDPQEIAPQERARIGQRMEGASPLERSLLGVTLLQRAAQGETAPGPAAAISALQAPRYSVARSALALQARLGL